MNFQQENKCIELDSQSAIAFHDRGIVKEYMSNPLGAIEDYTKAIQLKPDLYPAYYNRGLAKQLALRDYQGAIEDFTYAIRVPLINQKCQNFKSKLKFWKMANLI
jgi:tetratricopeptide (TPR) repeat protein